jgi:hypothetical protein
VLDLHLLGNRLDHEVDVAEVVVVGGPVDPPGDLLELTVGVVLGDLLLLDEPAELVLGHLVGLLQPLVHELLLHVLQDDGDVGGRDHLGDLPAHGAGAHDGGLEHVHTTSGSSSLMLRAARRGA